MGRAAARFDKRSVPQERRPRPAPSVLPDSEVNPKERYRGGDGEDLGLTFLKRSNSTLQWIERSCSRTWFEARRQSPLRTMLKPSGRRQQVSRRVPRGEKRPASRTMNHPRRQR